VSEDEISKIDVSAELRIVLFTLFPLCFDFLVNSVLPDGLKRNILSVVKHLFAKVDVLDAANSSKSNQCNSGVVGFQVFLLFNKEV